MPSHVYENLFAASNSYLREDPFERAEVGFVERVEARLVVRLLLHDAVQLGGHGGVCAIDVPLPVSPIQFDDIPVILPQYSQLQRILPAADVRLPQVFHPREGEHGVQDVVRRDVHLPRRFFRVTKVCNNVTNIEIQLL